MASFSPHMSSGRRRPPKGSRLGVWLIGTMLVVMFLVVILGGRRPADERKPPHRPRVAARATSPPAPEPAASTPPVPTPKKVEGEVWVDLREPTPTPVMVEGHAWIDLQEPTPRTETNEGPLPVEDCVVITSSEARQSRAAPGNVLVEVHIVNRCGRDLDPLKVWLEITGIRQGDMVQSVRGHPFEQLDAGDDAEVLIGLPGSIDWYDQIAVRVLPQ